MVGRREEHTITGKGEAVHALHATTKGRQDAGTMGVSRYRIGPGVGTTIRFQRREAQFIAVPGADLDGLADI